MTAAYPLSVAHDAQESQTPAADATPASEHDLDTTAGKLADLARRRAETLAPVGTTVHEKVREKGRLTVRDRLDILLDAGSFVEIDDMVRHRTTAFGMSAKRPVTDGIICGFGRIDGREVCVFSQDGTVFGGALGEVYGEKMTKLMDLAIATGSPLIGLYEGAGARIQDGVVSLDYIAATFRRNVIASGVIPQISVIMGACAGGNAYSPALTDFVVMTRESSKMFVTGPDVIKTVTSEQVTQEELGGADVHMQKAGNSHYTAIDEEDALEWTRELVSFLPANNRAATPRMSAERMDGSIAENVSERDLELDSIIPDSPNVPYDMRDVIATIIDEDEDFFEIQAERSPNVVIGFGRMEGRTVGFVANNPTHLAGCLDIDASEKAARFVRTCDAFNIPVINLVDVPGFLPGTGQEHDGILRRGAKLLYAYGEATVPVITIITRKAYGGAYCVMGSKGLGADMNLAWPTAQIAVMGAAGAVGFIYRKELKEAAKQGKNIAELVADYEKQYNDQLLNPYLAAERGLVDRVIMPSETRAQIIRSLHLLENKIEPRPAKKHGNCPM